MSKGFLKFLTIVFWIFVWWLVALIVDKTLIVPSPNETIVCIYQLLVKKGFILIFGASLLKILIGFAISTFLGIILGMLSGLFEKVEIVLEPIVTLIKSTPVMSFIIIAIIWFNKDIVPVFICFLMCLPVVYTNVLQGMKNVDKKILNMTSIYHFSKSDKIKHVYLQSIKEYIFSAMKTIIGLGFKVTIAAEILCNPTYGIGKQLSQAKSNLEMEKVFAWTVIIFITSLLIEVAFNAITGKYAKKEIQNVKN